MAVRVPPGANQAPAASAGAKLAPGQAAKVLEQLGLLKPGMSAAQITKSLVSALAARGFGSVGGSLAQQLSTALAAFQGANGLPVTGQLDAKTAQLLQKLGVLPRAGGAAGGFDVKDGFEGARAPRPGAAAAGKAESQSPQQVMAGVARAAADGSHKAMEFLGGLLGLGGGGAAGKQGAEGGTAAAAQGQGQAGVAEAAAKQGSGARADGQSANARADGSGLAREVAGAPSRATSAEKTRAKPGLKDLRERGLEDDGDDAEQGLDEGEGEGSSQGEGQGGGADDGAFARGTDEGDDDGSERLQGNASSGDDDDDDDERGHSTLDDGSGAQPGSYRMPAIAAQWRKSLDDIRRQGGTQNRATTYSWDVRFYRPGIYGPGQKAEEILHVVVVEATAFDRAWPRAVERLGALARRYDGARAEVPLQEDVLRAIRKARVT